MGNAPSFTNIMTNVTDEYQKQVIDISASLKTQEESFTDLTTLFSSIASLHGEDSQCKVIRTAISHLQNNLTFLSDRFQQFTQFLENLQINVCSKEEHPTNHAEGSGSQNGKPTPPGIELDVLPSHEVQSTQHMQEKQKDIPNDFNMETLYALEIAYKNSEQEKKRLQEENTHLHNTIASYTQRIVRLQTELASYKPSQITQRVFVQILQRNTGDLIDKVVDELISMLQCAFSSENIESEVVKFENSDDIRRREPLLIVCINASRLGSDAESAIKGIHGSPMTGLLIFHHKDVQLGLISPSDQSLKGEQFRSMGGIFDFAFYSGKGIYSCPMNDLSLSKVKTFIYKLNAKPASGSNSNGQSLLQKVMSPIKNMHKH